MAKHVFITGGVVSSLGKGITASSLGRTLAARGLSVRLQKCDPYLNVDPGTMNPFQHGEVFVTGDGTETDLDIGHYERFLDTDLPGAANVTTGQIYNTVITAERNGDYAGDTVQVIPHITDEIQRRFHAMHSPDVDIVITEIGGTVGDIESLPFLEAVRQYRRTHGRANVAVVHVSLVPYIGPSAELKTKPTQHSVTALRNLGLQPDAIVLRADRPLPRSIRDKIGATCDIEPGGVAVCADAPSIYDIPKTLHAEGLDTFLLNHLHLTTPDPDWGTWDTLLTNVHGAARTIRVGIVGKYVDLPDAYLSLTEAIRHAGYAHHARVEFSWIPSDLIDDDVAAARHLTDMDAVVVPGGFGVRGTDGMVTALTHTRRHNIPTLGICLGMQLMVIEHARHVAGLPRAASTEFTPGTKTPIITILDGQTGAPLGGTLRLGATEAHLTPGTRTAGLYQKTTVHERHRHRYEVNPTYVPALEESGLVVAGRSPDGLVDFIENTTHPFYLGTQAHPEYQSRPTRPHPLFLGLLEAATRDTR